MVDSECNANRGPLDTEREVAELQNLKYLYTPMQLSIVTS